MPTQGQPAYRPFRPGELRPNADGTYSTEITTTWQMPDGQWVNVPSLWMGPNGPTQFAEDDEKSIMSAARAYEAANGQTFQRFPTVDAAVAYAQNRSNQGGAGAGVQTGVIEVDLPDGSVVEFPDDTPPEVMEKALQERFGAPQPPSYAMDMFRSAGTGIRQGVESLAGMFGDANVMQGDLAGWAAGKFGASPETQETVRGVARRISPMPMAMSTEEIQRGTKATIGENYEPQTVPGEYARTVGQFAPAAVAGPGSVGRKVAMTAVPAVLSETAGQLTKGTAVEPYARAGAALAGGIATAGRPNAVKMAAKGAPTQAALKAQTDDLYNTMRQAGIKYDANEYGNTVLRMARELRQKGFRPVGPAKEAFDWIDELAKGVGNSPDFDEINSLIQSIGGRAREAARSPDGQSLAKALNVIRSHLDDFEESAVMISAKPMPKEEFNRLRQTARSTAFKNIKARTLEEIVDKADTYASGQESGIRNGIGNLLRSKRGMQMFKGEERKALLDVAQGRKGLRTLSRFGFDLSKLSGNATFLPTIGALGVGAANPMAGAALATVGTAAKALSPRLTQRSFDQATAAIRSGNLSSPQHMSAVKAKQMQALIRTLLTAKASEGSALANSGP